jgi:regulator of sigma E protease
VDAVRAASGRFAPGVLWMIEFLQVFGHNALWFVIAIGIMVGFHEFGHFWVARRFGVKVLRFSIGFSFGPFKPLLKWRGRDGVEYQIGSIPLGGYVKLLDEREGTVAESELPRAFNRQPVWVRIAVFAAGPAFNFILAVLFFWLMLMVGVPGFKPVMAEPPAGSAAAAAQLHEGDLVLSLDGQPTATWDELRTGLIRNILSRSQASLDLQDRHGARRQASLDLSKVRTDPQYIAADLGMDLYSAPVDPVISAVQPDSPAAHGGLKAGDRVLAVDGKPIENFQQFQKEIVKREGEVMHVQVRRGEGTTELSIIPARVRDRGASVIRIGAQFDPARIAAGGELWQDLRTKQQYGPLAALPVALQQTRDATVVVVEFVYHMVLGEISTKNISGPIKTAEVVGQSASIGLWAFLQIIALVSLNLGIVNLLPIPLLDGGQILYGLVEWVKGSPLSQRMQELGQQVGLTFLVLLMGLAFYNDLFSNAS